MRRYGKTTYPEPHPVGIVIESAANGYIISVPGPSANSTVQLVAATREEAKAIAMSEAEMRIDFILEMMDK